MNKALNQTLSRTIITSGTVFIATLALYIFGGGAINDFAFTFLVGIITGTYSSIYIASALVLWWHKGQRPATHSGVTMETAATAKAWLCRAGGRAGRPRRPAAGKGDEPSRPRLIIPNRNTELESSANPPAGK